MTPLTREKLERLERKASGDLIAGFYTLIPGETLRELLRGYEAWRDGIETIEKRIRENTARISGAEISLDGFLDAENDGLRFALDAISAGELK